MADQLYDILIRRGVGWTMTLAFTNDDDTPKDLTGFNYYCQVRNEGRLLADITVDDTNKAIGELVLSLTPAETAAIGESRGNYDVLEAEIVVTDSHYLFGGEAIIEDVATQIVLPPPES